MKVIWKNNSNKYVAKFVTIISYIDYYSYNVTIKRKSEILEMIGVNYFE